MQEVNKEEWHNWLEHAVTRDFFSKIKERREEAIERLAYGLVTEAKQQDITLGAVGAYTHVLNTTYED